MFIFSSFASGLLWTLFIFVVAFTASILQVHTITMVVLDGVEPLAFSIGVCFLFCISMWYVAHAKFYSRTTGPCTRSQGTQTSEELPCLSTIYASRGGKCYHISAQCPNNDGLQDITPLSDSAIYPMVREKRARSIQTLSCLHLIRGPFEICIVYIYIWV